MATDGALHEIEKNRALDFAAVTQANLTSNTDVGGSFGASQTFSSGRSARSMRIAYQVTDYDPTGAVTTDPAKSTHEIVRVTLSWTERPQPVKPVLLQTTVCRRYARPSRSSPPPRPWTRTARSLPVPPPSPRYRPRPGTPTMTAMKFLVTVDRDEDGAWVAARPAIPGCVGQGGSWEEAVESIRAAIVLCLKARAERDLPLTTETRQIEVAMWMPALPALSGRELFAARQARRRPAGRRLCRVRPSDKGPAEDAARSADHFLT